MYLSVSAALLSSALKIFLPFDDLLLLMFIPLYPLAQWTSTNVSLSHWSIRYIISSGVFCSDGSGFLTGGGGDWFGEINWCR